MKWKMGKWWFRYECSFDDGLWTIDHNHGQSSTVDLSHEFFARCQFNTLIRAIINTDALVLHDAITEHFEQIGVMGQYIHSLQRLGNGAGLDGAVANFCAADGAPHFMTSHAGIENFGHRIKSKLTWLGNHHVHDAHEIV